MARIVNPTRRPANAAIVPAENTGGLYSPPPSLGDRIRQLRREADGLEQQQHAELMQMITTAFPVFSVGQIWSQPELRAACVDAGLDTPQQLGIWLRSWCECVSRGGGERVWSVSVDD